MSTRARNSVLLRHYLAAVLLAFLLLPSDATEGIPHVLQVTKMKGTVFLRSAF